MNISCHYYRPSVISPLRHHQHSNSCHSLWHQSPLPSVRPTTLWRQPSLLRRFWSVCHPESPATLGKSENHLGANCELHAGCWSVDLRERYAQTVFASETTFVYLCVYKCVCVCVCVYIYIYIYIYIYGFSSLRVACWPLVPSTQLCGFKPGRSRRIFRAKKSSAPLTSEGE